MKKELVRHGLAVNSEQLAQPNYGEQNLASEFHKRLIEYIYLFDQTLDQEHEVGIKLVSFDQAICFSVTDLGYYNPSLICFYGVMEDGTPVQLIQHISQISFLLMAIKRPDPKKPKRPIGFLGDSESNN